MPICPILISDIIIGLTLISITGYIWSSPALPSLLRHSWLGVRKSIRPPKIEWWGAGMVICLNYIPLHPFNGLFSRTTRVSPHQKGKPVWILLHSNRWWGGSGISWTICKLCAPRSRQITMPLPHHSVFYRPDALPATQPTASKHWRHYLPEVWWKWFAYGPAGTTATRSSPASLKFRLLLAYPGCPEKRALNTLNELQLQYSSTCSRQELSVRSDTYLTG